jgi:aminoglycoside/choline kinase family phosphotransferase
MIPQFESRNLNDEEMIHFCRESLGLSESVFIEISPFEGRGSDRTFFRLKWNHNDSVILIDYNPKRVENTYYADIAKFLHDIDVSVPRLIRHEPALCLIAMEDLGDTNLYSCRDASWETRRLFYQKTLTVIHRLHSFPEKEFPSGRIRLMDSFSPDLYLWEQNYFRDRFVRDFCGIELEPTFERELKVELSSLTDRLLRMRRCLVHRDLQSQNVMIHHEEPFLIDFQGMRFGSPFYDLGSLLCDPYLNFSCIERSELLSFYYEVLKWDLDWAAFQTTFWEASAQRLMQALGAYGFLGLAKGLKVFIKHIPAGLLNLCEAASRVASLPRLYELSRLCQGAIESKDPV